MAKDFSRGQRIAEQMRRELADLLQFEVKDPRINMVTVTEVEVAGDMAHAKIYYSAQEGTAELQAGLERSAGFLRSQVAKRMLLRKMPQLHFEYDQSADYGMKMTQLIDEALSTTESPEDQQD